MDRLLKSPALWAGVLFATLSAWLGLRAFFDWLDESKGDTITRNTAITAVVIAFLSLLVTVGKAVFDVRDKQREHRSKQDEKKERLKVYPQYKHYLTTSPYLGLTIYNDGPKVSIRWVKLMATLDGKAMEEDLYVSTSMRNTVWTTEYELEPNSLVEFCMSDSPSKLPKGARYELIAETYGGTVVTVPHEHITKLIDMRQANG